MFGISKKSRPEFSELRRISPAKSYMIGLLSQMARTEAASLRVRRSEGLPAVLSMDGQSMTAEFSEVVNCLKVSSMLNPVSYGHPVDGNFEVSCCDASDALISYTVHTHFDDLGTDPYFEVTIAKKAA